MSVPKGKRSKSKVEFEMNYFKLADGLVKTPSHDKVVRERRRLKAFRRMLDSGQMTEAQIWEAYHSWRGTVILDHNACDRTIRAMDRHYSELFPPHQEQPKRSRRTLVIQTNKEADTEDLRYIV